MSWTCQTTFNRFNFPPAPTFVPCGKQEYWTISHIVLFWAMFLDCPFCFRWLQLSTLPVKCRFYTPPTTWDSLLCWFVFRDRPWLAGMHPPGWSRHDGALRQFAWRVYRSLCALAEKKGNRDSWNMHRSGSVGTGSANMEWTWVDISLCGHHKIKLHQSVVYLVACVRCRCGNPDLWNSYYHHLWGDFCTPFSFEHQSHRLFVHEEYMGSPVFTNRSISQACCFAPLFWSLFFVI